MRTRVLPPDEWGRLDQSFLPPLLQYFSPGDVGVVVVEDGDRIVASTAVLRVLHLEGLWIDQEHRNAGVGRALREKVWEVARGMTTAGWAFGGAADDRMRDLLERMGGKKLQMDSYALSLGR